MYAVWLFTGDRFKDVFFPETPTWNLPVSITQFESSFASDCTLQFRAFQDQIYLMPPRRFVWEEDHTSDEHPLALSKIMHLVAANGDQFSLRLLCLQREHLRFTKYYIENGAITIGRNDSNAICDADQSISGDHGLLRIGISGHMEYSDHSANGTYMNNRRILNSTITLQFGDTLTFPSGLKIICLDNALAVSQPATLKHIQLNPVSRPPFERRDSGKLPSLFTEYHRAPRIMLRENAEEIEIEPPLAKQAQQQVPIWMQIGPSTTMMIPMLMGTLVSTMGAQGGNIGASRLAGLAMIGTSSALAVMWGLINRRYRDKQAAQTEAYRIDMYRQYITEMEADLQKLSRQEYERLLSTFPNIGDCVNLPVDGTLRLWNRMPSHPDFLEIRLGLGDVELPGTISTQKQKLSFIDDPMRDEADRLKHRYSTIANAPVTARLRGEAVVGVLGGDEATLFSQGLMMQISALHSYHDVRIVVLTDEASASTWLWARWLPHVFANEDRALRMLASKPSAIHDIMSHLNDVLTMRRALMEERQGGSSDNASEDFDPQSLPLPHYIIFCNDSRLIENEPVLRHLLSNRLGMTLVMIAPSMELLPKECHLIFNVASRPGLMHTSEGDTRQIDFEYPNRELLSMFSHSIAPLRVRDTTENAAIPSLVSFLDIYGVRRVDELDIWRMWSENRTYDGIRSIIGYAAGGHPFTLDISDKYHGPHGLIAGTTGSGKSVMLQTYILSLALNYSPDEVRFILIDYKGGGMADAFRTLPHVAGIIDNLQGELVINRALASLNGEIHRRELIFKEYDVSSINDYALNYSGDPSAPTLPHLIIIVDEFAELKSEQPDFMRELVSASRVGRSLGVHLILATQKPSNSVSDEIWANSRFHLCLRVQTRADSMEMLKRPDAAYIKGMGRCFVQIGNDELFEQVQTSYSGLTYSPDEPRPEEMPYLLGDAGQQVRVPRQRKTRDRKRETTQMDAVLAHIIQVAGQHNLDHTHQMWLPQLPRQIFFSDIRLYADTVVRNGRYMNGPENLKFLLGLADDVARQRYLPAVIDMTLARNLMIVGLAGSGKTTAVQSIVTALAGQYDPAHLNIYILSLTSETLKRLKTFPQVGDVALDGEAIEIRRFINMLYDEQQRRAEQFSQMSTDSFVEYNRACRQSGRAVTPVIVVFVDRFEQLKALFANDEFYTARIHQLIREGSSRGIHFIVTALSRNEIPSKLYPFFTGVALQLRERMDYSDVLGKRVTAEMAAIAPYPGRGMMLIGDPAQPYEIQLALCGKPVPKAKREAFGNLNAPERYAITTELSVGEFIIDSARSDQNEAFARTLDATWTGPRPFAIPRIPDNPTYAKYAETPGFAAAQSDMLALPVGYDVTRGDLAAVNLEKNYSLFITGPKKSGRTNLLMFFARLFSARGAEVYVYGHSGWRMLADKLKLHLYTTEDEMAGFMDLFVREYPGKRKSIRDAALARGAKAARKVMHEQFKPCVVIIDDAERLSKGFTAPRFTKSPVSLVRESELAAQKAQEEGRLVPAVKTAQELAPGQEPTRTVPAKNYICDVFAQMAARGELYNLYLFMAVSHNERGSVAAEPLKTMAAQGRGIELGGRLNDYDPLFAGAGMTMQAKGRTLPVGVGYVVTDDGPRQIHIPLSMPEEN